MNVHLEQAVDRYRGEILDFTCRLISIASENPPGKFYADTAEAIASQLKHLGFESQIQGDCVLSYIGNGDDRILYFSGHYDVVPAQDQVQFQPVIASKNLFGRGSSDMKSGLAAMIYAAKAVRDSGAKLNGCIGLVFVPDEETAGPRGSRFLEERGLLGRNGVGMLTPEPTGGTIWNANRGAISLKITTKGKSAHVGRQFEGVNAFEKMLALSQKLTELKKDVEQRSTAFEIHPQQAKRSILLLGGETAGGTNFNVVPESCSFTADRRINPEEDFEAEKKRLLSLIDQDAEVEIFQEGRSAATPANTPLGMSLTKNIERVMGTAARFEMCPGLLETRFYAARGIPAYAYGPGLLTVSHGPKEFVPIENIFACAKVYAATALETLGTLE